MCAPIIVKMASTRSSPGTQTLVVVTPEVVVEVAADKLIWFAVASPTPTGVLGAATLPPEVAEAAGVDANPPEAAGVDVAADGPLCNK